MKTRGQRKKQGLQFRDDGRSVLSQIALIEDAARKGTEESILTQRPIEEENPNTTVNSSTNSEEDSMENLLEENSDENSEKSTENSTVNSVKKENSHIDTCNSNIIRILRNGEIVDLGRAHSLSSGDSESDSQGECDNRGFEFTQITNTGCTIHISTEHCGRQ